MVLRRLSAKIRKAFAYLIFGIGSIVIGLIVLPIERLLIHPKEKFKKIGRYTISYAHKLFVLLCEKIKMIEIKKPTPDFSDLKGVIIAPTHPTLFDVVILFSLIPGADCIVRGALTRTVTGFIVRALYIVNSENFEELKEDCRKSLENGNNLIIFPEGTRTRRGTPITLKRGIAYISLHTKADVIPIIIGGNDKQGLQKKDHFYTINNDCKYIYTIKRPDKVFHPYDFSTGHLRTDATRFTEEMESYLRQEAGNENH